MENTKNITLTVVVLDENSQFADGSKVSITPSNASGITNKSGEVQFTLTGTAIKYDVTASSNGKTVTVPFYVTEGGATRLVVNPVFVTTMERQLHPFGFFSKNVLGIGIGFAIIVLFFVAWNVLRRRRRRKV